MPAITLWVLVSSLVDRNILIFVLLALLIYFLHKRENKTAILIFVAYLGGVLLNKILKEIFQVPRPVDALIQVEGYAFPSGHATSAVIFYSLLILLFHKRIKNKITRSIFIITNVVVMLLVGVSRIMLKVHSFYDVIAGYLFGLLWLFIVYKVLKK